MQTQEHIPQNAALQSETLSEKIATMIQNMPKGDISLAQLLALFEDDGLLLLAIFLSLIFLVPVSIPGVSTVFGFAILLIGIARLFNRRIWLPERIAKRSISAEQLTGGLNKAMDWFHRLEKISRPHRMPWFTTQTYTTIINKLAFILAALLLIAPFGFIPFSNTLPALALILFAIGELVKDGVSILLGHLANIASIIYFGFLIAAGGFAIFEGLRNLPIQ
jgi:hypothetical protein